MQDLQAYVAFDLEFNTVDEVSHIIQVSAVKFEDHKEVATFDSYVYTDVPLQSFINGLTGITSEKIAKAPQLAQVLADFVNFVGNLPLMGYNGQKSDLPLLAENGLDLTSQYVLDLYEEARERRSSDLNGIVNLKLQSVANYLGIKGRGHNSLEDARMTAQVYEALLELETNRTLLKEQEEVHNNPFSGLDLSGLFD